MPVLDLDHHLKHETGVKSVIAPFPQIERGLGSTSFHSSPPFAVAAVTQCVRFYANLNIHLNPTVSHTHSG
jgi:hypothetical protein